MNLDIEPFFLHDVLVHIQHTQCPGWLFILERYKLCGRSQNYDTGKPKVMVFFCFFVFFASVLRLLRPTIPETDIFQLWVVLFNKAFLRAAFESPWDSRGRTFSEFLRTKKWRRYHTGQIPSPECHTEFPFSWNPPVRLNKKRRETLPLAVPHVELDSDFTKEWIFDRFAWFSAKWSILSWSWPDFVARFGWLSVTYLILV